MPAIATDPVTDLIDRNMGLAYRQVFEIVRISQHHADYDECVQVARIALWKAIRQYNPAKMSRFTGNNVKLSTYAVVSIQRALRRWMQLRDRHGFSKVGDGNRKRYWESFTPVNKPVRLDQMSNDDNRDVIRIEADASDTCHETVLEREVSATILGSLGRLWEVHPKMASIMYRRHIESKTLQDIADEFGLSKQRIQQILVQGAAYMREDLGDEWEKVA